MTSSRHAAASRRRWTRSIAPFVAATLFAVYSVGSARAATLDFTNISAGKLQQVDTVTKAITTLGTVGGSPDSLIFDPAGRLIWTDLFAGTVNAFDLGTKKNTVLASGLGSFLQDLALEPSGTSVLVTDTGGGNVYRVPLAGGPGVLVRSGLSSPRGIIYDPSGNLFLGDGTGAILQLDPVTGKTIKSLATGATLDGMTYDPVTGHLWASNGFGGGAGLIEVPTDLSKFTSHAAPAVDGIESDGAGLIYMADSSGGNVLQYNIATGLTSTSAATPGIDDLAPVVGAGAPPPVPEPASLTLLGIGACSMAGYGWRRGKSARQ
jgi:DNA-binding beta-propeller fold protein YncE